MLFCSVLIYYYQSQIFPKRTNAISCLVNYIPTNPFTSKLWFIHPMEDSATPPSYSLKKYIVLSLKRWSFNHARIDSHCSHWVHFKS